MDNINRDSRGPPNVRTMGGKCKPVSNGLVFYFKIGVVQMICLARRPPNLLSHVARWYAENAYFVDTNGCCETAINRTSTLVFQRVLHTTYHMTVIVDFF